MPASEPSADTGAQASASSPRGGRPASAGPPRGGAAKRRTTKRGQQTRERILRAATELFSTRGFATTRVDDVLRASGTGKSQFYHHFEDKADLGRAVLRNQRAQAIPHRDPRFGHLDSWERLAAWFDDILRSAERALRGLSPSSDGFSFEPAEAAEPLRREFIRTASLRRRLLTRGLRRMQRRGLLRKDADPARLASFAASAIQGGLMFARNEGSDEPLRDALGEAFDHLRRHAVENEPHS